LTCLFPSRGLLSAGGYSCRVEVTLRVYDPRDAADLADVFLPLSPAGSAL
jgi:hypothetical protein